MNPPNPDTPPGPESLNRELCEAASDGDAARVASLLAAGADPRGFFDAAESRRRSQGLLESMDRFRAEQPDPLAGLPEELRAAMAESTAGMFAAFAEQFASAPASHDLPLFCAAESGSPECVKLLLGAGANPLARDNSGRTAIYAASDPGIIALLVSAGAPLEDADQYGWSPLTAAVCDGREALPRVRALLAAGADVNAAHDRGYTVFMSACGSERDPEVLRTLIAAGADPHALTDLGYNAFHAAIDVNGGANAEASVRATLSYLKELGVAIEHRDHAGQTPLARAIECGTGVEVAVLCELGAAPRVSARVHRCGDDGCSRVDQPLLFHAVLGSGVHADVKTEALLKAGADPRVRDADGASPLEYAVARLCEGAPDLAAACGSFFAEWDAWIENLPPEVNPAGAPLDAARAPVRAFVERFAAGIPIPRTCQFDDQWRLERIGMVASLALYSSHADRRP